MKGSSGIVNKARSDSKECHLDCLLNELEGDVIHSHVGRWDGEVVAERGTRQYVERTCGKKGDCLHVHKEITVPITEGAAVPITEVVSRGKEKREGTLTDCMQVQPVMVIELMQSGDTKEGMTTVVIDEGEGKVGEEERWTVRKWKCQAREGGRSRD
ncbi:hypothetical protein FH972_014914 [Carpinus fangiana]|uniref:Uncharacterized protein n=1 Tax=Carpinus fangiana TaxID=176857 RepID=A0A5N6RES7_9ROSI|nr:hypothetical protein FH972_014914 [Carpinus fangiana]